jgi:hypothetical protein
MKQRGCKAAQFISGKMPLGTAMPTPFTGPMNITLALTFHFILDFGTLIRRRPPHLPV